MLNKERNLLMLCSWYYS